MVLETEPPLSGTKGWWMPLRAALLVHPQKPLCPSESSFAVTVNLKEKGSVCLWTSVHGCAAMLLWALDEAEPCGSIWRSKSAHFMVARKQGDKGHTPNAL